MGTQITAQGGGKFWSCQSSLGIAIGKVVIWWDIGGGIIYAAFWVISARSVGRDFQL